MAGNYLPALKANYWPFKRTAVQSVARLSRKPAITLTILCLSLGGARTKTGTCRPLARNAIWRKTQKTPSPSCGQGDSFFDPAPLPKAGRGQRREGPARAEKHARHVTDWIWKDRHDGVSMRPDRWSYFGASTPRRTPFTEHVPIPENKPAPKRFCFQCKRKIMARRFRVLHGSNACKASRYDPSA